MPRPEELPPSKRVDELVTEITLSYWEKYKEVQNLHERDTKMITELIRELAIERAKNEILSK